MEVQNSRVLLVQFLQLPRRNFQEGIDATFPNGANEDIPGSLPCTPLQHLSQITISVLPSSLPTVCPSDASDVLSSIPPEGSSFLFYFELYFSMCLLLPSIPLGQHPWTCPNAGWHARAPVLHLAWTPGSSRRKKRLHSLTNLAFWVKQGFALDWLLHADSITCLCS